MGYQNNCWTRRQHHNHPQHIQPFRQKSRILSCCTCLESEGQTECSLGLSYYIQLKVLWSAVGIKARVMASTQQLATYCSAAIPVSLLLGWQPSPGLPQLALFISISSPAEHCILQWSYFKIYHNVTSFVLNFYVRSFELESNDVWHTSSVWISELLGFVQAWTI